MVQSAAICQVVKRPRGRVHLSAVWLVLASYPGHPKEPGYEARLVYDTYLSFLCGDNQAMKVYFINES